jgi:hypothetical protein
MTNKSYAITMSLLRIGVLAAQIAVSSSAAAHFATFSSEKATGWSIARAISHISEMISTTPGAHAEERKCASPI